MSVRTAVRVAVAVVALTLAIVVVSRADRDDAGPPRARGSSRSATAAPSTAGPESVDVGPTATSRPSAAPAPRVDVRADPVSGDLKRFDQLAAAGRRTLLLEPLATVDVGLGCPDGTHLPLLNGVATAPALIRADEHGPLPPVVAIVVDAHGFDWYEHADGSTTTTRPQYVTDAQGRTAVQVVTLHLADGPGTVRPEPGQVPGSANGR